MNRVVHFEIQADNIERAKAFYKEVFGWEIFQMMSETDGGMNYWGISTGKEHPGIDGGLYQRPEEKENKIYLYDCTIEVADLDKSIADVLQNGGTIIREKSEIPGVGFFAAAKDSEGNRFGMMQTTDWQPK